MSTISSQSEVRRFRFNGSDRLFLDPQGHRVVADFEGSGDFWVDVAEAPLLILRDEEKTDTFPGSFANSLTVLAIGPGEVQITVARDLSRDFRPPIELSSFEGAGWILEAQGELCVDGRCGEGSFPTPDLPIPFFRYVQAERLRLSPALVRTVLVDRWRIDDLSSLKSRGWKVQNISKLVELESILNGQPHRAPVACHLNAASWICPIPPENLGLRLRKTYDRFHGRQRARVFIDGEFAGWWYEPQEDRLRRWGISEFGIPDGLTAGKAEIEITIDPPAGSPLWSVSAFEVHALLPLE